MKKELKVKGRKIIALGLIALMLFVPFSSNLGDKMRTMAEEGNPDDGPEPNPGATPTDVTVDYTAKCRIVDAGSVSLDEGYAGSVDKIGCLKLDRKYNLYDTYVLNTLSDNLKINLKADATFVGNSKVLNEGYIQRDYPMVVKGAYKIPGTEDDWVKNVDIAVTATIQHDMVYTFDYKWSRDPKDLSLKYWADEEDSPLMNEITISKDQKTVYLWARPQVQTVKTFKIINMVPVGEQANVPEGAEIGVDWKGEYDPDNKKSYEDQVSEFLSKKLNEKALYRRMLTFEYNVEDVSGSFKWVQNGKYGNDVYRSAVLEDLTDPRTPDGRFENGKIHYRVGEIQYTVVTEDFKPKDIDTPVNIGTSTDVATPLTPETPKTPVKPSAPTDLSKWGKTDEFRRAKTGFNYGFAGYVVGDSDQETLVKVLKESECSDEIDCTPPTIELVGLYKLNEEGKWENASDGNDVRVINAGKHQFRYVVRITDPHGVNAGNVYGYSHLNNNIKYFSPDSDKTMGLGDDCYYYQLTPDDVSEDNVPEGQNLVMYINAGDSLGNWHSSETEGERMLIPAVRRSTSSNLDIIEVKYYDEADNDIKVLPGHTNKQITIYVHAIASAKINRMVLSRIKRDDEHPDGVIDLYKEATDSSDGFVVKALDPDTMEGDSSYEAEYKFKIPGTDVNAILESLIIEVYDEDYVADADDANDHYDMEEVGNIALDGSLPEIGEFTDAKGNAIDFDNWYADNTLKFKVTSGDRSEEDYLESVKLVSSEKDLYTYADDDAVTEKSFTINPSASQDSKGTHVVIEAIDKSENKTTRDVYFKVDQDKPTIKDDLINLYAYNTNHKFEVSVDKSKNAGYFREMPSVKFEAQDAITLAKYTITVNYPSGDPWNEPEAKTLIGKTGKNVTKKVVYDIPLQNGKTKFEEGVYEIAIDVYDMAGSHCGQRTIQFTLDNDVPVVNYSANAHYKNGNTYYDSDKVVVDCEIVDTYVDYSSFVLTDSYDGKVNKLGIPGNVKNRKVYITEEGEHKLVLKGNDCAGREADEKQLTVIIDKTAPKITLSSSANASNGGTDYRSPATVSCNIDDLNFESKDATYSIKRSIAGSTLETSTDSSRFNVPGAFREDGDYEITVDAYDLAGNLSENTINFRVDQTAPQIQILGASADTSNNATVTFEMIEAFWNDTGADAAKAEVTIYRKPGDGIAETEYKKMTINPTGATTRDAITLSETGTYRIEMVASDRAGNSSNTNAEFTIDKSAPVITIQGATDFDKKSEPINVNVEIAEDFYVNKTVSIKGTRKIASGKVESLDFTGSFVPGANPTKFVQEFKEDGIYDLTITATDPIGNSTTKTIHFTIDQTKPVIGDLSKYDNKVMNNFTWDIDTDKLVTDLTVCDVHVYLNGIEYDGSEALEDGAYTLLVTAVDELGHESEATANFVIDTKAPVFIITGVKDGEIKNEPYNITISLQLADDILDSVLLNGQSYTIGENNTVTITVNDGGKYELTLHARDAAGNEAEETLSFVFGKEKKLNSIFIIAAIAGGILVIGGIIFIILAKRRKEDDRY